MAYLSGIKHRLFIREESTYGDLNNGGSNTLASAQGWIAGLTCYTRPGAKISVQNNPIVQAGMGQPSAVGRGRSSVAGSFSFYLPKADRLGSTISQTQGFLLFFKHLYGDVTRHGTGTLDHIAKMPVGSSTGDTDLEWKAHFSKFDTVKDHRNTTIGDFAHANIDIKESFSFISFFSEGEAYLYTGVCPTSMSITASDANSLITADVSFIARSVHKIWYDPTAGTNTGTFKPFKDEYISVSGNTGNIAADGDLITQAKTTFFTDTNSPLVSDTLAAIESEVSVDFNGSGTNPAAITTSDGSGFEVSGISINITKPLGHTNEFGGSSLDSADRLDRRFNYTKPRLTGNKSLSGSFTMPIQKAVFTNFTSASVVKDYTEYFRRASQGIENLEDIALQITFSEAATSRADQYVFDFDNVVFGSTDFANIDTGISTTTVNWSAIQAKSSGVDSDRFATLTYKMN